VRRQYYIAGRLSGGDIAGYLFRRFAVSVRESEGRWVPDGPPIEETHLYDPVEIALDLEHWQIHTTNTAGKLDDMPCPEGWRVMARDWLPDDYSPPAEGEIEQRRKDAIEHLKKMGVWRDPS
jgi:hypothetical protein